MQYVDPETARTMPGLRLALTAGLPAPYSLSARAILDLRGVPYVAVRQDGAGPNEALVAWTRHRNAPVAVYEDEAPRTGWLEILLLAERLGSGESLIPDDVEARMRMIGLAHELIGENGLVWNLRIVMLGLGGPERAAEAAKKNPMYAQYGYSEAARAVALGRAHAIMDVLTAQAAAQRAAGSRYLVGDRLTALDIYWVYFSQLLVPIDAERCPTPAPLLKSYTRSGEAFGPVDPFLIEQRDRILADHLECPMTF